MVSRRDDSYTYCHLSAGLTGPPWHHRGMDVVFAAVAALVLFAVVAVVTDRAVVLDDDPQQAAGPVLPPESVDASDIDNVRFAVVTRGYRMDHVDDVLGRLGGELAVRDRRIAELEAARQATPLPRRVPGQTSESSTDGD